MLVARIRILSFSSGTIHNDYFESRSFAVASFVLESFVLGSFVLGSFVVESFAVKLEMCSIYLTEHSAGLSRHQNQLDFPKIRMVK